MVVNYRSKKFYNIGPRSEFDGLTELGRKVLPGTRYTRSYVRDENKVFEHWHQEVGGYINAGAGKAVTLKYIFFISSFWNINF